MPIYNEHIFKDALAISEKITKGSISKLRALSDEIREENSDLASRYRLAANLMERDLGSRAANRPSFRRRLLQQNETDAEKAVSYRKTFGACAGVTSLWV